MAERLKIIAGAVPDTSPNMEEDCIYFQYESEDSDTEFELATSTDTLPDFALVNKIIVKHYTIFYSNTSEEYFKLHLNHMLMDNPEAHLNEHVCVNCALTDGYFVMFNEDDEDYLYLPFCEHSRVVAGVSLDLKKLILNLLSNY
jgi:hypothetical protein